jgi:hypothetical protein
MLGQLCGYQLFNDSTPQYQCYIHGSWIFNSAIYILNVQMAYNNFETGQQLSTGVTVLEWKHSSALCVYVFNNL